MTLQGVFDKVVTHLRTQGKKSKDKTDTCMYLDPEGNKCAAGCLIPPEDYNPAFERGVITLYDIQDKHDKHDEVVTKYFLSKFSRQEIWLIRDLQIIHDTKLVGQWESEFAYLAKEWNLTYNPRCR